MELSFFYFGHLIIQLTFRDRIFSFFSIGNTASIPIASNISHIVTSMETVLTISESKETVQLILLSYTVPNIKDSLSSVAK